MRRRGGSDLGFEMLLGRGDGWWVVAVMVAWVWVQILSEVVEGEMRCRKVRRRQGTEIGSMG